MTATFYVGDSIEVMSKLPENSVDLVLTSPPFLALRSYLPQDHPDKNLEGGSQATPGEYVDWLLDVVEACARVLAPHGSLCFELGDTYSGSGGAGGDYAAEGLREGQPRFRQNHLYEGSNPDGGFHGSADMKAMGGVPYNGGRGWPLAKSLSLIPESFRWAMVYGHNPFTGRKTAPWRLRNVIRWVRPNPPVGALGDKFRPATSELMVFCKAKDRYFDLDAVRGMEPEKPHGGWPLSKKYTDADTDSRFDRYAGEARKTRIHPEGAPPLDWWNIPLLEGEEPTPYGPKERPAIAPRGGAPKARQGQVDGVLGDSGIAVSMVNATYETRGGAPPLDWWNIPPGGYSGFTTRTVQVPVDLATFDGFAGDIQCITSADCPEHGDRADPAPTGSHDGRGANPPTRNLDIRDRLARARAGGSVPTDPLPLPTPEAGSSDSPNPGSTPAATPRSKPSRRTALAPATNLLDTPSEETGSRIGDTSESPSSDGLSLDSPGNRNDEADPSSPVPETDADTDRIPGQPSACTCSYFVEKSDSTSHYAVWPPELLIKPIKAMCPEKVCRTCGEPSRRISEAGSSDRIGSVIRTAREALGLDRSDLVPLFLAHYKNAESIKAQISNWELGKNVPMAFDWMLLKDRLGFGDGWDHLIPDRESVTYAHISDYPSGNTQNAQGEVYQRLPARKDRIAPDRFSDCGHDSWRPGLVLDPFAGSGTTLAVATGHGRDAIGIDLDSRNYDLALDRVGPLILELGSLP